MCNTQLCGGLSADGLIVVLFAARFCSIAHLCVCTTLQVVLPHLDSLVRLVYPAEDGKMTLSLISSSAGE